MPKPGCGLESECDTDVLTRALRAPPRKNVWGGGGRGGEGRGGEGANLPIVSVYTLPLCRSLLSAIVVWFRSWRGWGWGGGGGI